MLEAILESFIDGVLILTEQGEWVRANDCARRICHQLCQRTSSVNSIPESIWRVCKSLIDSRDLFLDKKMIIESEISLDNLGAFRIRVRWLELDESEQPYLLVTLEDRLQSTHNAAIADAKKYGFTEREAEVWLLRQAKHSYKEIAAKLYITLNTVKKHMKNIYAKQQADIWVQE
ncbi:MAG: LuxR C-terminal-related transcriptional regulator [Cyanobacteriota bacterium]|nr:LuxR C-terminal-related transcriptional regulator [Cyanobacteriota bacterium]